MNEYRQSVLERQEPLRQHYRSEPRDAWITDRARTAAGGHLDPFHAAVLAGENEEVPWRVGIHRAVGGFHDLPNPGDILCAALATCLGTTVRMIAARLGIGLEDCEVRVKGHVDVRGTLAVDRKIAVGFQRMTCQLTLRPAEGVATDKVERLVAAAEQACVVLQTLRQGVPVDLERVEAGGQDEFAASARESVPPASR